MIGEFHEEGKDTLLKTYLWGLDLSQSSQGAGGVGGLLATAMLEENGKGGREKKGNDPEYLLPIYDGNGNVMGLVLAENAELVAYYAYGPFGELQGRSRAKTQFVFQPNMLIKKQDYATMAIGT